MDISKTSNMYIALAEIRSRVGDDLEDQARDLAQAFTAVVCEGLGLIGTHNDQNTIEAELRYLLWGGDKSHRGENVL